MQNYSKTVFESQDSIDRRLVRLYRLKRLSEDWKRSKAKTLEEASNPGASRASRRVALMQYLHPTNEIQESLPINIASNNSQEP